MSSNSIEHNDKADGNIRLIFFTVTRNFFCFYYRAWIICQRKKRTETSVVGEGCSPLGRRHEVTEGDSPVRGNVRKADKRVAVLAERKASPPRNAPAATFPPNATHCGANQSFRRVRRLRRTETYLYIAFYAEHMPVGRGLAPAATFPPNATHRGANPACMGRRRHACPTPHSMTDDSVLGNVS